MGSAFSSSETACFEDRLSNDTVGTVRVSVARSITGGGIIAASVQESNAAGEKNCGSCV